MRRVGIQLEKIHIFFEIYHRLKQDHLKAFLKIAGQCSYDSLVSCENGVPTALARGKKTKKEIMEVNEPIFDEKEILVKLQINNDRTTKPELKLHPSNDFKEGLGELYYEMYEIILKRLDCASLDCLDVLTKDHEQQPIVSGDFLGEFNGPIVRKKRYQTKSDNFFYKEEPSEEETETENHTVAEKEITQVTDIQQSCFTKEDLKQLTLVTVKKPLRLVQEIEGCLAGQERYRIELFNIRNCISFTPELRNAHTIFQECAGFTEGIRVKIIFAIADLLASEGNVEIEFNNFGRRALKYRGNDLDSSLVKKIARSSLYQNS